VIELTVSNGPKAGADVLRTLDAAEVAIAGLALREPSLDDVFLNLTGHKTTIEHDEDDAAAPKKRFGRGRKSDATDGKDAA
jgi:ABC-2 type transport system ATP-binding protein